MSVGWWAVLIASFLGSWHCAGMCGPLVALAVGGAHPFWGPLAYHLTRGAAYALWGALAGALGAAANWGAAMMGLGQVAAVAAGVVMALSGLFLLWRQWGGSWHVGAPEWLRQRLRHARGAALKAPPMSRAVALGALSALLPCGWLWAFVVVAAGTGSAAYGALAMAAFWLGTLPALTALGWLVQRIAGPLAPKLKTVAALVLIFAGLWTVTHRYALAQRIQNVSSSSSTAAPCHGAGHGLCHDQP